MGNEWKEDLKFNPQKPKRYTSGPLKNVPKRKPKANGKKQLIQGVMGVLAVGALFTVYNKAIEAGIDVGITRDEKRIEMILDTNRQMYDKYGLLEESNIEDNNSSYELLLQECSYYDAMSNGGNVEGLTQEETLNRVKTLRNLYFEIVKSKIAYAYGLEPEKAEEITYFVEEPLELGKKEVRINIPNHDSLVNDEIPTSLQDMIKKTTNLDEEKYGDESSKNIISDLTYYAGALNKFAKSINYELDKDGKIVESGRELGK